MLLWTEAFGNEYSYISRARVYKLIVIERSHVERSIFATKLHLRWHFRMRPSRAGMPAAGAVLLGFPHIEALPCLRPTGRLKMVAPLTSRPWDLVYVIYFIVR